MAVGDRFILNDMASATLTQTMAASAQNVEANVSAYIGDTTNFSYRVEILSATNTTDSVSCFVTADLNTGTKKIMFNRAGGLAETKVVTVNYRIIKSYITNM